MNGKQTDMPPAAKTVLEGELIERNIQLEQQLDAANSKIRDMETQAAPKPPPDAGQDTRKARVFNPFGLLR